MSSDAVDRQLLDVEKLDHWLTASGLKVDAALNTQRLAAGRSNEMFVLSFTAESNDTTEWVLRRPAGLAWEKAEKGLQREYQLLNALSDQQVAAPRAITLCEDKSVIGALFYIMEKIDGFIPAMGDIPADFLKTKSLVQQTAFAGIEAIADIHRVDWHSIGLASFGKPDDYHQRQVGRWTAQLNSYGGRELPTLKNIGDWLQQNLPRQWTPTIMHGDYHPLNILMDPQLPPKIAAIVDWETSTIGDPLLDLVGYLDVWYDANPGIDWPGPDEMISYYLSLVDFEPHDMIYYRLLYYFRQSVLLEGIYQRSLNDKTRKNMDEMAEHVDRLIDRAETILGQHS